MMMMVVVVVISGTRVYLFSFSPDCFFSVNCQVISICKPFNGAAGFLFYLDITTFSLR